MTRNILELSEKENILIVKTYLMYINMYLNESCPDLHYELLLLDGTLMLIFKNVEH